MANTMELAMILKAQNTATKQIQGLQKEIKAVENQIKQTTKVNKAELSSFSQDIKKVGGVIAGAFAINKIKDFTLESVSAFESFEQASNAMAEQFDVNKDEILATLKEVSGGTVANSDLVLAANRAMALNVTNDVGEMSQLLEFARLRARAMGLDTTQAFNDIVTGIGRGSPLILDNLGIITKGWDEEAKAADKAFDSQFILNKVLQQSADLTEKMGDVQLTNKEKALKFRAEMEDLRIEIGAKLLPVIQSLRGWISENLLPTISMLTERSEDVKKAIIALGVVISARLGANIIMGIAGNIKSLASSFVQLGIKTNGSRESALTFGGGIKTLKAALISLASPLNLATLAVGGIILEFLHSRKKAEELEAAVNSLGESLDNLGQKSLDGNEIIKNIESLTGQAIDFKIDFKNAEESNAQFKGIIEELRNEVVGLGESFGLSNDEINNMTSQLSFFSETVAPTREDIETLKSSIDSLDDSFENTANKFNSNVDSLVNAGETMESAFTTVFDSMRDEFGDTEKQSEKTGKNITQQFTKRIAELEGIGKAYGFGISKGMTRGDVKKTLENSGIVVSDKVIGTLLKKSIAAKDAGEVYGLLVASGVDEKEALVASSASNLGDAVRNALANKSSEVASSGSALGGSLVGGMIKGLKDKFPELAKGLKALGDAFGISAPEISKAFLDKINFAQGVINQLDATEKAFDKFTPSDKGAKGAASAMSEAEKAAKEAEKQAEELAKTQQDLGERVAESGQAWRDMVAGAEDSLSELTETHEQNVKDIEDGISQIVTSLQDLETQYNDSIGGIDLSIGEEVVKQQQKIADLRKSIEKEQGKDDVDSDRLSNLEDELKKEEAALRNFLSTSGDLQEEIDEAKRRSDLTSFERFIEDQNKRRDVLTDDYNRERDLLEVKKQDLEKDLEDEKKNYEEKRSQYEQTLDVFNQFKDGVIDGFSQIETKTETSVKILESRLSKLKSLIEEIKSVSGTSLTSGSQMVLEGSLNSENAQSIFGASQPKTNSVSNSNSTNITINVSGTEGMNEDTLAKKISSEFQKLSRSMELKTMGVPSTT